MRKDIEISRPPIQEVIREANELSSALSRKVGFQVVDEGIALIPGSPSTLGPNDSPGCDPMVIAVGISRRTQRRVSIKGKPDGSQTEFLIRESYKTPKPR